MSRAATRSGEVYDEQQLTELRMLTEAEHFLAHMDSSGNVPAAVFEAVALNRETSVAEIAMPYAVTTTEHEVSSWLNPEGRRERVITWLGRTALEVAASGYDFHFSEAAYRRIPVEEAEAVYVQQRLRSGVAQPFISPRMTPSDASEAVAKAEHLHTDDAVRVSTAITDSVGQVVGRRLQSLLVRDVPFAAWVSMLKDPGNIFGQSFTLRNETSAVSVMELFEHMELLEEDLPEGPVSLVAAVLPYIADESARQRVAQQLRRFRGDQTSYAREAKNAGREWAVFDLELARSLRAGTATEPLRFFIMQNAHSWNEAALEVISGCEEGNTAYYMTTELATVLARAKQELIGKELAVVTDNDLALGAVSLDARYAIRTKREQIILAYETGAGMDYIRELERQQYELLHQQHIRVGGGCAGSVADSFTTGSTEVIHGDPEGASPFKTSTAEDKTSWSWKPGVCQVKACPSPKPTEVGPCSVCRRCQAQFDKGRDPTRVSALPVRQNIGKVLLGNFGRPHRPKASAVPPRNVMLRTAA